eukprot:COSAG03_NODE_727_length_6073_cov_3.284901_13_plen_118_part_00
MQSTVVEFDRKKSAETTLQSYTRPQRREEGREGGREGERGERREERGRKRVRERQHRAELARNQDFVLERVRAGDGHLSWHTANIESNLWVRRGVERVVVVHTTPGDAALAQLQRQH